MLHPLPRLKKDENEIPSEEVKKLELFDGWNVMGENKTVPSSSPDYLVGDGGLSWRNKSVRSTTRKNWRDRGSTVNSNLETERAKPELSPNTQSNSEFIYKPRSDGRVGWKKDDRRNQNLGGPQREQGERENQGQNREQRGYHTHHQHQQFDRQGAGSSTRQQKEPQQQQTEPQRQKPERQEEEHSRRMDDETSLDLDIDPNEIAAAALKARLMGDTEEFEKLEKKLEALKKIQTGEGSGDRTFLPEQDSLSRNFHFYPKQETSGQGKRRKAGDLDTHHQGDGKRRKYYSDDNVDLKTLMKREKHGLDDYHKNYLENVCGNKYFKYRSPSQEPDFDDDYVDTQVWESKEKKMDRVKIEKRQRKIAVNDLVKKENVEMNCFYCFQNKKVPRHLVLSIGEYTYLMLPTYPLCKWHCLIVPIEHFTQGTPELEELVWKEVEWFMKCLTKMNYKCSCGTVFMETNVHLNKGRHTVIECFRLDQESASVAHGFFKKALEEDGPQWSQHRKLIHTSGKGIRNFPSNFPFFHVQFGMTQGFAHVIENEKKFKKTFGHEILAAVMQLDVDFIGKNRRKSLQEEKEMAKEFLTSWLPFDWTTQLEGGSIDFLDHAEKK
eukprot:TRINITY_DN10483_c0_g1_i19.p1 TRINITY_DN10483_c0_g1~~TRINITY_DN10483_c0_g1_i19.p1  ORF type:complete len:609 (-),score=159.70 TRINITY_DN10483_c0_g1_i19:84-1910(-)